MYVPKEKLVIPAVTVGIKLTSSQMVPDHVDLCFSRVLLGPECILTCNFLKIKDSFFFPLFPCEGDMPSSLEKESLLACHILSKVAHGKYCSS